MDSRRAQYCSMSSDMVFPSIGPLLYSVGSPFQVETLLHGHWWNERRASTRRYSCCHHLVCTSLWIPVCSSSRPPNHLMMTVDPCKVEATGRPCRSGCCQEYADIRIHDSAGRIRNVCGSDSRSSTMSSVTNMFAPSSPHALHATNRAASTMTLRRVYA